jgi:hypothetical protein
MPTELRHLLFRTAEIVQAIKEYHRRLGQVLPAGPVLSCGAEYDGEGRGVQFCITIAPDPADAKKPAKPGMADRQDVVIEGPTFAAALILYCRDRRIPLPANADKSLQLFGGLNAAARFALSSNSPG